MFFILLCFIAAPLFQLGAQQKGKILIAYEKTRFKNALVEELDMLLKRDGYSVETVLHSKNGLDKYKASDYRAVFITNSGVNSEVRPWVNKWIEKNKTPGTYILLHTTQAKDWQVRASVDTVTSASAQADVKKLANDYYERITKALNKDGQ